MHSNTLSKLKLQVDTQICCGRPAIFQITGQMEEEEEGRCYDDDERMLASQCLGLVRTLVTLGREYSISLKLSSGFEFCMESPGRTAVKLSPVSCPPPPSAAQLKGRKRKSPCRMKRDALRRSSLHKRKGVVGHSLDPSSGEQPGIIAGIPAIIPACQLIIPAQLPASQQSTGPAENAGFYCEVCTFISGSARGLAIHVARSHKVEVVVELELEEEGILPPNHFPTPST